MHVCSVLSLRTYRGFVDEIFLITETCWLGIQTFLKPEHKLVTISVLRLYLDCSGMSV